MRLRIYFFFCFQCIILRLTALNPQKLMKFILKLSLAILVLAPVSWETTQASSDVILVKQERILKEEYQMVRQMRHRLRYLLEQQDMENTLQEGEDVFQDLQQLEQWLEEMKRNPENANMEALMQMMQQLEQRMNESFHSSFVPVAASSASVLPYWRFQGCASSPPTTAPIAGDPGKHPRLPEGCFPCPAARADNAACASFDAPSGIPPSVSAPA